MPDNFMHTILSNRLFRFFTGITCLLLFNTAALAQIDSVKADTIKKNIVVKKQLHPRSPKKAALFSAIVPGAGQAYNKKYWKIPVFYAGLGALAYSLDFNQKKYVTYRNAYRDRIDSDPNTIDNYIGVYSNDQLVALYKYYYRYRDLSAIGLAAVYIINIVDATVDAHLSTFDISDDLTLNIHPDIINTAHTRTYTPGVSLSIKF